VRGSFSEMHMLVRGEIVRISEGTRPWRVVYRAHRRWFEYLIRRDGVR